MLWLADGEDSSGDCEFGSLNWPTLLDPIDSLALVLGAVREAVGTVSACGRSLSTRAASRGSFGKVKTYRQSESVACRSRRSSRPTKLCLQRSRGQMRTLDGGKKAERDSPEGLRRPSSMPGLPSRLWVRVSPLLKQQIE